jgi:hypothetical protein
MYDGAAGRFGMADESAAIARELIDTLAAPRGAVTVLFSRVAGKPLIVVRLAPGIALPSERRPAKFHGMDVIYQVRRPAHALKREAICA